MTGFRPGAPIVIPSANRRHLEGSFVKHVKLVVLAVALFAGAGAVAGAAPASAATRCLRGSNTYSGRCFTSHQIYSHLSVVEAVPLVNRSRHTATFHCSFTRTITRSFSVASSVSAEAKATLFELIDASTTVTVQRTVTQTASQATEAGLSVRLRPGQRATCQRTYGSVTTRIKDTEYTGLHSTSRHYQVRVPSFLGVRLVN
jgi:hypothetical protein